MIIVAGFFAVIALLGLLFAFLEFAAWQNSVTPSQSSPGCAGATVFIIAGILALVFLAGSGFR